MGGFCVHLSRVQLWVVALAACACFSSPVPVQGLLYGASHSGVVQVPVANCSLYQSCGDCLLARDPYCAWSGSSCKHVSLYRPAMASR